MSKLWLVARYHFLQETTKRSFLIVLFSLPLFLAFIVGLGLLFENVQRQSVTLGYVDPAGLLVNVQATVERRADVRLMDFDTPEAALAAVNAGQIDAYIVLPADYPATRAGGAGLSQGAERRGPARLLQRRAPERAGRTARRGRRTRACGRRHHHALAQRACATIPTGGPSAGQIVPLIAAAIFTFLVLTTSDFMLQALVSEKENRTIEVIVSSVSPAEMMAGKIVGAIGIALLQLAVWLICLVAAAWVGGNLLDVAWLRSVQIGWRDLLLLMAVALPAYFCIAALMTLLGTMMGEGQEAQQASGLLLPAAVAAHLPDHPHRAAAERAAGGGPEPLPAHLGDDVGDAQHRPGGSAVGVRPGGRDCAGVRAGIGLAGRQDVPRRDAALWAAVGFAEGVGESLNGRPRSLQPLRGRPAPTKSSRRRSASLPLQRFQPPGAIMNKMFLVMRHEIYATLRRPTFVIFTFGMPVLLALVALVVSWRTPARGPRRSRRARRVDRSRSRQGARGVRGCGRRDPGAARRCAGWLADALSHARRRAQAALQAGEITGYYLIPADYAQTGQLVYALPDYSPFSDDVPTDGIERVLLFNLLGGDAALAAQVRSPLDLKTTALAAFSPSSAPRRGWPGCSPR